VDYTALNGFGGLSGPRFVEEDRKSAYAAFRIDRNRILSFIAFWATAPGDRLSFFAACDPDNRLFANARRFFTSSLDHATNRLAFAIISPSEKASHHSAAISHCVNHNSSPDPTDGNIDWASAAH
jgi:hypothetical protein